MSSRHEWSDHQILTALNLREHHGYSCKEIGERFGTTKNAIIGLLSRVNIQADKFDPDGNQNGTMPENWWKK